MTFRSLLGYFQCSNKNIILPISYNINLYINHLQINEYIHIIVPKMHFLCIVVYVYR